MAEATPGGLRSPGTVPPQGADPSPAVRLTGIVLVTGTGTGVGKTVATAALAAKALARGARVAVFKPAQTGVTADEPGDIHEVGRLLGAAAHPARTDPAVAGRLTLREGLRLRDPLAPSAAARREGRSLPTVLEHAHTALDLAREHDLVLVEGAGGLLVELDTAGGTLADLAIGLHRNGFDAPFVVVCAAGLGTLNHTALTAEALTHRGLRLLGLVVGAWPAAPEAVDLAMGENLLDLPRVAGAPLLGRLPDGAGAWDAREFARGIPQWLAGVD